MEITISLLTPYAAFLPAQALGVSGVIATVAAGLYLGRRASHMMGPDARLTGRAVWETITFLLNGIVFIMTGLEVPLLLRELAPATAHPAGRHRHRGEPGPGRGPRAVDLPDARYLASLVRAETRPPRLFAHVAGLCPGPACAGSSPSRSCWLCR